MLLKNINCIGTSTTVRASKEDTTNATTKAPCDIRNKCCQTATHLFPDKDEAPNSSRNTMIHLPKETEAYPHIIPLFKKETDESDCMLSFPCFYVFS